MATATSNKTFPCPGCAAAHEWRPEYVDRVAKCACGRVLKVPNLKLRDDTPSEKFAAPRRPPAPASAVAPGFFPPSAAAPSAAARSPGEAPMPDEGFDPEVEADLAAGQSYVEGPSFEYNPWKDFQFPVALIIVGLLPVFAQLMVKPSAAGLIAGVVLTAVVLVVNLALMLAGVLLASKFAGIHFGELKPAILKLTAVYVGPSAIGQLITAWLGGDLAVAVLGNAVTIVLYWMLLSYLFRLDGQQTMICVGTIWAVRFVTSMCVLTTLIAALGSFVGTGPEAVGGNPVVELSED